LTYTTVELVDVLSDLKSTTSWADFTLKWVLLWNTSSFNEILISIADILYTINFVLQAESDCQAV
jgi:hypothetical protein